MNHTDDSSDSDGGDPDFYQEEVLDHAFHDVLESRQFVELLRTLVTHDVLTPQCVVATFNGKPTLSQLSRCKSAERYAAWASNGRVYTPVQVARSSTTSKASYPCSCSGVLKQLQQQPATTLDALLW